MVTDFSKKYGNKFLKAKGTFSGATASEATTRAEGQTAAGQIREKTGGEERPAQAIIAIGQDKETGKYVAENVGKNLTTEQKRQVTEFSNSEGRLVVSKVPSERTQAAVAIAARQNERSSVSGSTQREYYAQKERELRNRVNAGGYVFKSRREEEQAAQKKRDEAAKAFREATTPPQSYDPKMSIREDTPEARQRAQEMRTRYYPKGSQPAQEEQKTQFKDTLPGAKKTSGTLTPWKPTPAQKVNRFISTKEEEASKQSEAGKAGAFVLGAEAAVAGVPRGFFGMVRLPYDVVKGGFSFFKNPKAGVKNAPAQISMIGAQFGEQLRKEPGATAGEFVGAAGATKLGKEINPFVKDSFEIETSTGTKTVSSVGVRNPFAKEKAVPFVSKTPAGIQFGNPDIRGEIIDLKVGSQIKPEKPLGTNIITSNAKRIGEGIPEEVTLKGTKPPEQSGFGGSIFDFESTKTKEAARLTEAPKVAQDLIKKTRFTKNKKYGLPTQTERLNAESTKGLLNLAKEEGATLFGSGARRATIKKEVSDFVPRDLDIELKDASPKNLERVRGEAVKRIQSGGQEARLSTTIPEAVEVKTEQSWMKAVEFKGKGLESPDTEISGEYVLGFEKASKPIKVEGQKVTSLNQEQRSVTQGVIRVSKKKGEILDIYPSPKREKDIGSVVISTEELISNKRIGKGKTKANLAKFKSLFGVTDESLASQSEEKIMLADFSSQPRGESILKGGSPKNLLLVGSESGKLNIAGSTKTSQSKTTRMIFANERPSPSSTTTSPSMSAGSYKIIISSPSASPRRSPSPSLSMSPSTSPKRSTSMSPSPSPRSSPYRIISPSFSPSPGRSTSPSPSPYKLNSPSPYMSPSPRTSPSPSPSPGRSLSPSPKSSPSPYLLTPPRPPVKKPSPYLSSSPSGGFKLFDVLVRRRGKFSRTNPLPLTRKEALNFGANRVGNTAAATFKIVKATRSGKGSYAGKGMMQDFDLKRDGMYIERPARRIKSSGELKEITYEGIRANKNKRTKKKIMGIFG